MPSPPHTVSFADGLAPRGRWGEINDHCAIARTLEMLSTRSAFLLLREAFYGTTRFDEFAQRAELSEPVTAARLKELSGEGLLEKVPYREPGQRTRSEYQLTDKGADLFPVLMALWDWGDRWALPGGARLALDHRGCGAAVHTTLRCERGHRVSPSEVEVRRRA